MTSHNPRNYSSPMTITRKESHMVTSEAAVTYCMLERHKKSLSCTTSSPEGLSSYGVRSPPQYNKKRWGRGCFMQHDIMLRLGLRLLHAGYPRAYNKHRIDQISFKVENSRNCRISKSTYRQLFEFAYS